MEISSQKAFLKSLGCDLFQGYLSSPPLPGDEFRRLLTQSAGNAGNGDIKA